jgi:hypothetical protein
MKNLHISAIVCFAAAIAFYLLAWLPGAMGLTALGCLLEIVAWVLTFTKRPTNPYADSDPLGSTDAWRVDDASHDD